MLKHVESKLENCSDSLYEKIALVIEEKLLKFKAESRDHWNNLFKQRKVRPIFEIECFYNLFLEVSDKKLVRTIRIQI